MKTVAQTVIEAGCYYTIAAASGNVVEYIENAGAGAELRLGRYEHKPTQEWVFDRVGENSYRIHCRANGKVIDLMMAGTDNGTWLHLWDDVMGGSQIWTLVPGNDGRVRLISQWASGKNMDTVGIGSGVGAILQIWQETGADDQLWTINAVKDRQPAPEAEVVPAPTAEAPAEAPASEEAAPAAPAEAAAEEKPAEVSAAEAAEAAPAPKKRAARTKKAAAEDAAPAEEAKPKRRACRTKKGEPAAEAAEAAPAPKKRATRAKKAAAEEAKPKRRGRPKKTETAEASES